ncbi:MULTISPECIES: hypothetical protein [unclassified Cupriavidus]|uniref:hypothetical protein n=1 Tax=unclassified Cupriavidus TaxID=2640874 RepID=UPI001BFFF199|nr:MULTISPECIES: hypothetical protein [unclassified Cupriavidus]MCA3183919.1 hypothetical protein [Cupriavidus sp.]MCA3194318.1 hypothetical protein [Cupriavidus sp.]MCA3200426.1 hypothetical protein [Cupriavidus sp.]MCA3233702.1 hypothetical protein [Cupriavidus sp.]QWE95337.1 hypothetical protein KLP38_05425 [Cupriavidus sp. EM10]
MPLNGYSVGRDFTLVLQTPTGPLQVPKVTGFSRKMDATTERVKRIDGVTDNVRFFDGWSGSLQVQRTGPDVDRYFATIEANYYAGLNEQPCQIYETITEPNGAVSQFRYDGVMLTYDNPGDVAGDATVKMQLSFTASRRFQVS